MTQTHRHWTLMVYMAGDNGKVFELLTGEKKQVFHPMEEQGWIDIKEMEAVGSTDQVAVLVQFDTLSNREHTFRIYIPPKSETRDIQHITAQNTGDPTSLRDFIVWGIQNYPAENYAVIIWNHGTGWNEDDIYDFARHRGLEIRASQDEVRSLTRSRRRLSRALFLSSITEVLQLEDEESRGIAYDDSSLDFLDNAKLQQAFQEAEGITGQKVSLIGMDACLMSMVEVAYQLRANANYMIASQEVEPMSGWPYTKILQSLTTHPQMTSEVLAKLIVQEYGRYYEENFRGVRLLTQSATNLTEIEKLAEVVGRLATVLRQLRVEKNIYIENALYHAQKKVVRFTEEPKDSTDLYDFLEVLLNKYGGDSTLLTSIVDEIKNLITIDTESKLVLENVVLGSNSSRIKGLSIYLPMRDYSPFYDRSDFAKCGWGEFIRFHNTEDEE
ncbi:MAG: clostripain-related cysteine peptidase [Scytonema sp. PMC 1069.18]|nr:clostripain-related cysteine peptidase [Scytonema sp. PMC 1069.18]MEC4886235.1 clostripain-related cysteine peptidase [Scytonema sp. PMC 1070.18]